MEVERLHFTHPPSKTGLLSFQIKIQNPISWIQSLSTVADRRYTTTLTIKQKHLNIWIILSNIINEILKYLLYIQSIYYTIEMFKDSNFTPKCLIHIP